MTPEQHALIERARTLIEADARVDAAWLAGSFGTGRSDAYSDIDVHLLIAPDSGFAWTDLAEAMTPAVLCDPIPGVTGGLVITPEWMHVDIVCHTTLPPGLQHFVPLVDRAAVLPTPVPVPPAGEPYFPHAAVNLYFYLLGNLAVVLGRGELLLATNGAVGRRDAGLVPLMLAANGVRKSDGAKRLYPYLRPAQIAFLEGLPPLSATRASVITFDRLVAAEVIRVGRALAGATGAQWPAELEEATLAYLARELGEEFIAVP